MKGITIALQSMNPEVLKAIKRKFGNQIPELEEYDSIYGIQQEQTQQEDDATMLDPSLIQPIG